MHMRVLYTTCSRLTHASQNPLQEAVRKFSHASHALTRAKKHHELCLDANASTIADENEAKIAADGAKAALQKAKETSGESEADAQSRQIREDEVQVLRTTLEALNLAVTVAQGIWVLANTELVVATAAAAAALISNWIPFWNCGPSEAVSYGAVIAETEALASETAATVGLELAEAAEVKGQQLLEKKVVQLAEEESLTTTPLLGNQVYQAAKAESYVIKAVGVLKKCIASRKFAATALRASGEILTKATADMIVATKAFALLKAEVEKLLEGNKDWQAFKGLDNVMNDHPCDGEYDPEEDPKYKVLVELQCPGGSESGGPDFFGILESGLEEGQIYTFITVISGLAKKFQEVFPHICTMYAVKEHEYGFLMGLVEVCNKLGISVPHCLSFEDLDDIENREDADSELEEEPSEQPTQARRLMGKWNPFPGNKGFTFAGGTKSLNGRMIQNVAGSSPDNQRYRSIATGWLRWYREGMTIANLPGWLAGAGGCACRIEGQTEGGKSKNYTVGGHSANPVINSLNMVGGHMDIDSVMPKAPPKNKWWGMLPICKGHNAPAGDYDTDEPNWLKCKPKATCILIKRKTGGIFPTTS